MTVNGNMQVAIIIINNNNKKSTICLWKEEACITLIKNDKYKIELYTRKVLFSVILIQD